MSQPEEYYDQVQGIISRNLSNQSSEKSWCGSAQIIMQQISIIS